MARHLEANCQLCRRCGDKLMLKGNRCMTPKCVMERRHKTAIVGSRGRRRRVSERGTQLIEKQKARYIALQNGSRICLYLPRLENSVGMCRRCEESLKTRPTREQPIPIVRGLFQPSDEDQRWNRSEKAEVPRPVHPKIGSP